MAVIVDGVFHPDRDLPADLGLPVEGPLTGVDCGDVQRTAGAALEPGPVEEDARTVDGASEGGRFEFTLVVLPGVALGREAVLLRTFAELHVAFLHPLEAPCDIREIVGVDEMSAVRTAAVHGVGIGIVGDALAPVAVDAGVVRAEVRGVEQPGSVLVRVLERDPLVEVLRCRHRAEASCPGTGPRAGLPRR